MALDRENRPDMILSKLSANYLGAISDIHKIFFNTIPAPWVLILKGGIWLLFGHLLEVLLKSKIISIQIFYGRIFLSFLNEWILYSSDSKHHIWPCHCLRHHWIRLQKIFLRSSWICRQNCRVAKNSELKGAHFEIFQGFSSNFAKNVRFLYYREANKKRHVPLKVAPMCSKVHGFNHPAL